MNKEDLQQLVHDKLGDYKFIVVSNRQPYQHIFRKGKVDCVRAPGGVVSALDPIMQACRGLWVAVSNSDADRKVTDASGKLQMPPHNPSYTLKRLWLTKEEEEGYYYGYSNNALWPLNHMAFERPVFNKDDWDQYVKVNKKFAQAIVDEIKDEKAFVWIQDYHLCLLPKFLKEMRPQQVIVAHFWHIPWPSFEAFRICPQQNEILEGMLANDYIGFHIRYHCLNFIDVVDRTLECKVDRERFSIIRNNHETLIRPHPISVDFKGITEMVDSPEVQKAKENLFDELDLDPGPKLLLGVDRIDYTKGIPERILAVDRLLEKHPEFKEKIVLLQMGVISRLHLPKYKALNDEINALVEQINWKHSTGEWKPVIFVRRLLSFTELAALYSSAEVCLVSSLHDGMNLVAKEYVAARKDERGALVLSQFTGAARELTDAILINPYDREQFSDGIYKALTLSDEESRRRMAKMRQVIEANNIYNWAAKIMTGLLKFEFEQEVMKE